MKLRNAAVLALIAHSFWLGLSIAEAQVGSPITKIEIQGNHRVSDQAIRARICSHVGQPLEPDTVSEDIKAIYYVGDFRQVQALLQRGTVLVFVVEEGAKPKQRSFPVAIGHRCSNGDY
jgi:outer membrane protein assembly factor BamA